ncbi:MAG: hypothetical protein A3K10_07705 [Bacteroidetes bacterium RIFCSPLOWO2_12_FULL_31_6]|nr:MAG: hypothetical protein A3K10_07705 [Bacteroidetes bacterium RIFCSPLOWO2_12_FULL_31_6]
MKNLAWPNKIIFLINILGALLLVASYSASYINPKTFWPLSFFGLAYPLILLINIAFVIYWAIFRKKQILLSLIIILLGLMNIRSHFQINLKNKNQINDSTNVLKVISYNVRLFDLYEWSSDRNTDNKIFELIKDSKANIICMQEFMNEGGGGIISVDSMVNSFKANQLHAEYTDEFGPQSRLGIAIFSSYPIVEKGRIDFGKSTHNICIYTDINVNGDTIRVYNVHFQSIHFGKEDYITLEKIDNSETDDKKQWMGIRKILKKLKIAFSRRSNQAELVANHIKHSPYKVILCGDFNDTPGSYSYHTVAEELNDAFIEKGTGLCNTYLGLFPFFRIDYILHSKDIECLSYERIDKKLSDHYPISSIIKIK